MKNVRKKEERETKVPAVMNGLRLEYIYDEKLRWKTRRKVEIEPKMKHAVTTDVRTNNEK